MSDDKRIQFRPSPRLQADAAPGAAWAEGLASIKHPSEVSGETGGGLTAKERETLRHVALIAHGNGHDGRDIESTQDRVIATVERILADRDPGVRLTEEE